MKTETKTIAEYKAPRCKVVEMRLTRSLLTISDGNGYKSDIDTDDDNNLGEI